MNIPLIANIPFGFSMKTLFGQDVIDMIIHAGPMAFFILLVLLVFSIICWAIVFLKFRLLRNAARETKSFMELFWENREMKQVYAACEEFEFSPVARLFKAGYSELRKMQKIRSSMSSEAIKRDHDNSNSQSQEENVNPGTGAWTLQSRRSLMENLDRTLKKTTLDQVNRMEKALNFLATAGNTAPFIGLFGTVWGLMEAFRSIGMKGSANLAVVAPGISDALITTAAGLAVAIPAVIAFNYFAHRIMSVRAEMDIFTSDFLSMVERQFFKDQF